MLTLPSEPTLATTSPEMASGAVKLSEDEFGAVDPVGHTERKPSFAGEAAVTLRSTESTPLAGTTEVPVTRPSTRPPAGSAPAVVPTSARVSRRRVGVVVLRLPKAGEQPTPPTSTPVFWLTFSRIRPSLPTPTTAWLATTSPDPKFTVDEADGV